MTGPADPSSRRPERTSPGSFEPGASRSGGRTAGGRDARVGAWPHDREDREDRDARLAPREEQLLESSVVRVGSGGRGPFLVAGLVVAAFLLGLLRPWDLLAPSTPRPTGGDGPVAIAPGPSGQPPESIATGSDGSDGSTPGSGSPAAPPPTAITCGYPSQWRSSTIEDWTGRQARVWKAATVVDATGPDDPAIPFEPIVAATITAIGWCAPVDGPDRPPLAISARLYRVGPDGVAAEIPYLRLEPAQPDALGELWVPPAGADGASPSWPLGRYVIALRSASGAYARYLGLELTDRIVRPSPVPSASAVPSATAAPSATAVPSPSG